MTDPLAAFRRWWEEAGLDERAALATATPDGRPSVRMVLVKAVDEQGFVFYSGYESRKGRELAANPRGALLFHWPSRQARVEGPVERVSPAESDAYWATRPPGHRRSAAASRQSEPIDSRDELEARAAAVGPQPARPPWWGGYRLVLEALELWEHREDRLHDRQRWTRTDGGWRAQRLQP